MKSCYTVDEDEIMPVKPNANNMYPVQITLSRKEYQLLRKEAFKVDKTVNKFVKDTVLNFVQTKK